MDADPCDKVEEAMMAACIEAGFMLGEWQGGRATEEEWKKAKALCEDQWDVWMIHCDLSPN